MKKNLLILLFFAFVVQARADLLIEPYVGVIGNGNVESKEDGSDEDYSGNLIGGRLGFQTFGLFGGIDYRLSNIEIDDTDATESQYSLMVGYDFPILFRVWGQYILGGEAELDNDANAKYKKPTGTVLGVGFTGLPFVSLNFEMANYEYDEVDFDGGSVDGVEMQHYVLSVSLPLTL